MVSIGNTFEQRVKVCRLDEHAIRLITDNLKQNDIYGQFTFLKPSTLGKTKHTQFVLLNNKHVVYFNESEKFGLNYKCFDPLASQSVSTFIATDVASETDLERYPSFPIRESLEDMQLITQITVLLFDVSSSMKSMVGKHGSDKQSLLDLSVVALGVWCDKVICYRFSQAIGLIHFGANGPKIEEKCSISKDLSKLESALSHSPQCGSSTPLYDAIEIAIQAIARFRMENAKSISTECRSLIVCFSDGEDNDSKRASFETVKSKMKDANIVFDTVSFLSYESSKLFQLCEATNGFYYINVPHDKSEMTKLFEREASLMICERNQTSTVRVEMPEKRPPKRLHEPARNIENAKINTDQMSNKSNSRIIRELHDLKNTPLANFTVFLMNDDVLYWKVIMKGPDGTPYADYYWLLSAEFPPNYPFQAPKVRFITPIYHCNISDDGRICHEILHSKWTPSTTTRMVFEEIHNLLIDPNPDDAVSTETSIQYRSDPTGYEKTIKRLKEEQAKKSISEIMKQYQLEED